MTWYEKDEDWARWRPKHLEPLGVGPVILPRLDAWKTEMRPAGQPQPRDLRIAEYKRLRAWVYGPPLPIHERQYLGPPPSSAASRLYEYLSKETALELAAQLRNYPDQTTRKGPQEKGKPIDP